MMTDTEIGKLITKRLRQSFKGTDFESASVNSEEDFDGSSVIRVIARFKKEGVPAKRLADALHQIRMELLEHGEDRFVFLGTESPSDEEIVEEDAN